MCVCRGLCIVCVGVSLCVCMTFVDAVAPRIDGADCLSPTLTSRRCVEWHQGIENEVQDINEEGGGESLDNALVGVGGIL